MTLKLRDGVSAADTDYGITLLDEDSGQYWNLNPTGALVLRTLLEGGTRRRRCRSSPPSTRWTRRPRARTSRTWSASCTRPAW